MTIEEKEKITGISREFASAFKDTIGEINGSGWLIVDPLSGYLNFIGYENKLQQLPEKEDHPLILIMTFNDGSKFIPAGGDLKTIDKKADNWMWLEPETTPQ